MSTPDFSNKEYRDAFVDAMIRNGLAFQIRALRENATLSQKALAELIQTKQNVISRYENPDYGSFSLATLKSLASALDVALICRFATFSELRRFAESVSSESIAVPNYAEEMANANVEAEPQEMSNIVYLTSWLDSEVVEGGNNASGVMKKDQTAVSGDLLAAQTIGEEYAHANC